MKLELNVGEPITHGGLALFPLFGDGLAAPPYLPGPVATESGQLLASELAEGAEVPWLQVNNDGDQVVLLVEGEMLLGCKQNRTLNLSVLCPPTSVTEIPVSCVEAGRWGRQQASHHSSRHASLDLRREKTVSTIRANRLGEGKVSDQGAVWDEVDRKIVRHQTTAPTVALEDVYNAVEVRSEIGADRLRPAAQQRGVVAAIGGVPVALDLFDKAETLQAYWESIVEGYALEAIDAAEVNTDPAAVDRFLVQVGQASEEPVDATGLGREVHVESEQVAGAALLWDEALVHLSAYALHL